MTHTGLVGAVAVAPDGSWLASGGWDGTVRIWDAAAGQDRAALPGHTGRVAVAVAVAPDGSWLASGGGDGTVGSGMRRPGGSGPSWPATPAG